MFQYLLYPVYWEIKAMKSHLCGKLLAFILVFCLTGICIAQENTWKGTVRFNPADNFINLHNALPGLYITWTPYILHNLGVSAQIDVNFGWGVLPVVQIALLSGVEYIPIGPQGRDKNGLFLDGKIGLSVFINNGVKAFFIAKTNIGYQLIIKNGFVFTPGVGVVYNSRTGFGLNIMLDLGFAYRGRR